MKYRKIKTMILAITLGFALTGCMDEGSRENIQETQQETQQDTQQESKQESFGEIAVGDMAPDFTAELTNGESVTLSEEQDKVVLLNFWATWCGPCVNEMPALERLQEEYGDQLLVLAVNSMEDKSTVDSFVEEKGYTFSIAYDVNGEIGIKYPTSGIPYTLIIGKDGTVKQIFVGAADAETQYMYYKNVIETVLKE